MHGARGLLGLLAFAVALLPAVVRAEPTYALAIVTVHGSIEAFTPNLGILVRDKKGYFDRVVLKRHGTIINPRGKRLARGMVVTIRGLNQGATLLALQIDVDPRAVAARWRAEYMHAMYARAAARRLAARRLAEERRAARLARLARLERPRPKRVVELVRQPHAAHPALAERTPARRIDRLAAEPAPPEILPTWYGWGNL